MKNNRGKKKKTKLLALLLAMAVLCQGNGLTVLAETISGNQVLPEEGATARNRDEEVGEQPGSMEKRDTVTETLQVAAVPEGTPENPRHNCTKKNDGTDTTEWSYVYFGSYPKSEVRDSDTISAIETKIAEIRASGSGYPGEEADTGTDVWVDGIKYRRIAKSDANYGVNFGDGKYRYFKWERIKWKVLENDGTNLFLMADDALDCQDYCSTLQNATWETSTMRTWLNSSFYHTAFNSGEQNGMISWNVKNENNPVKNTIAGNDTEDRIYLLSFGEAMKASYGFCKDYGINSVSRQLFCSDYAWARGVYRSTDGEKCWWWLRSPGGDQSFAACVSRVGAILYNGDYVTAHSNGITPVLHIKLSSDVWFMADDGTSGEGGEDIVYTFLQATKTKTTYIQGEHLNMDDLQVEAEYFDHGEKKLQTLQADAYTTNAEDLDMATPGQKTLTISYTEQGVTKTADIAITVNGRIDCEVTGYNSAYDGKNHGITVTVANPADAKVTYSTDESNYSVESPQFVNQGQYKVSYRIEKEGYETVTGFQTVNITPRDIHITAEDQRIPHGGVIDQNRYRISAGNLAKGDSISAITLIPSTSEPTDKGTIQAVGIQIVNAVNQDVTGNYHLTYLSGKLVIIRPAHMNAEAKISKNTLKVTWKKVKGAEGYEIYAIDCGKENEPVLEKTVSSRKASATLKKISGKKVSMKTPYKLVVKAYRTVDGQKEYIAQSLYMHLVGSGSKVFTNAKSIKVTQTSYKLKKGRTATIQATIVKQDKTKKLLYKGHGAKLNYFSDNTNIATVSSAGKIKAVKKGSCYIYVTALNGVNRKIKVTVY